MLNIPEYRNYSGETKIALMDNSTVAFLEQVERAGSVYDAGFSGISLPEDSDMNTFGRWCVIETHNFPPRTGNHGGYLLRLPSGYQ